MIDNFNIPNKCCILFQLIRLNKPDGLFLLLWPTLWSLFIVNNGMPNLYLFTIFVLGVFFTRSIGCLINDLIDQDIDCLVKRTKNRPFPSNTINHKNSITLCIILIFISFILIILLNNLLIFFLSLMALFLIFIYPYIKRYSHFPQIVLGIAFSLPVPMVFITFNVSFNKICWLLFLANFTWTIAYDTQYAIADRDDDIRINIKSTAIFFGKFDKFIIALLQVVMLFLFLIIGLQMHFRFLFYFSLVLSLIIFIYQQKLIANCEMNSCIRAFSYNNYVGFLIFIGILLG
ncbi:4-hydroxybenzoate octaprenyltransferase [Blochmannia endosymbiont of Colobopsis nipponica]|uniref:4-hydroxybenzoate octaprenyltransferase n=1 Tax=Blochmannia endosymbiont of Colobopsis nipponica TaxID=2681987 RepID=UPI00177C533A|nr:4-hydroxybenzoate octaprenyltransferase [Blochmannia endosymbiont of Colobopsis nipponica]QOI10821.1 4-hydroxybenzoate octaprenyltransferase [Blochmannia endosymbiont of Colobopsis nipponica]